MKYEEMTKEQCDELDAKFFKLSDEYMERVERAREKMEKLQKMDDLMEYYINHVRPFVQRSEIICAKWVSEFEVYVQFTDMEKFLIDTNSDSYVRLPYTKYNVPDDFAGRWIGMKIRARMRWAKIGQKELAEKVGVARQSINTIVNGKAIPNSILLRKIAMALNCTVDDLYYNDYE